MAILDDLQGQTPGLDDVATKRARAAATIQLQQQIAKTALPGTGMSAARGAQTLAPAAVQQQAGVVAAGQQQQQALAGQEAQTELQRQRRVAGTESAQQELGQTEALKSQERQQFEQLAQEQQDTKRRVTTADIASERRAHQLGLDLDNNVFFLTDRQHKDLAVLDERLVNDMFEQRRLFDRDEAGRKFSNEQQLLDWSLVSANSRQEFLDRSQEIQNEMKRESALFDYAIKDMQAVIQRGYITRKGDLDGATKERLINMQADMKDMLRAKEDEAKAQQARIEAYTGIAQTAVKFFK